mgnify:CR=1 FL=1
MKGISLVVSYGYVVSGGDKTIQYLALEKRQKVVWKLRSRQTCEKVSQQHIFIPLRTLVEAL